MDKVPNVVVQDDDNWGVFTITTADPWYVCSGKDDKDNEDNANYKISYEDLVIDRGIVIVCDSSLDIKKH